MTNQENKPTKCNSGSHIVCPFTLNPLTDLTAGLVSHQWFGNCQVFELNLMECYEFYGLERGHSQCKKYLRDFRECTIRDLQVRRAFAMRFERHRQYYAGERTTKYAKSPRNDVDMNPAA